MDERVLVDTSAWVDFFRDRAPAADAVASLLRARRAVRCGPVDLELRRGLRGVEAATVLPLIRGLETTSVDDLDFASAGDLLGTLARQGTTLPSVDGLIAAIALRHDLPLLATDRHFDAVPGLRRWDGA